MEDPLRSATAVIVAASYPTSTKSSAAASRKPASRRVERSCCGATRMGFDEIEGTLVFYNREIEAVLDLLNVFNNEEPWQNSSSTPKRPHSSSSTCRMPSSA